MIRKEEQAGVITALGATPVVSDIAELDDLLAGSDAVMWATGAGGGSEERT